MGEITEVNNSTGVFTPPQKTIVVKPIMRARNSLIQDPEHEAFFLFGTATITYCLPVDRHGNLLNPFSNKAEQRWLERELDADLNIHKNKENFWHNFKVRLGKEERKLNLKNPKHYLEYLVLKANSLYIAPDGESMSRKATYRYALVSEEFETNQAAKSVDLEMEAFMNLGSIKDDREAMIDFLKIYGKKVSPESKRVFLVSELKKIIEKDIDGFLHIFRDKENYELKLLIARAVEVGAILKQGRKYHLPGGDDLCGPGDVPTINTVIEYLKNPANQDIVTMMKARVNNAKD